MKLLASLILSAMALAPLRLAASEPDTDLVFRTAAKKMAAFDAAHPEKNAFANDAKGATWTTVPAKDWVAGFYPGCLWYITEYARQNKWPDADAWQARAEAWTAGMKDQQFNVNTHDTGFMIFDSYGNGYRITKNPAYLPIINRTAQSLASRFLPSTGTIRSWGKREDMKNFNSIMDNMMNLELLMWASKHGGTTEGGTSDDLRKIAMSHADRSIELFVRPNGSTYHVVELNPKDGSVVKKRTQQGKGDETTWSRGQTWAMYGFSYMAETTGEKRYLDTAIKVTDFYLSLLPKDFVPPSDFDSTLKGLEFKDTSAAAVAACALLRLEKLVTDPALKQKYHAAAVGTLKALSAPPYFSTSSDKASILLYAARDYKEDPNDKKTNTSLIFGDYYLLEGLLALKASEAAEPAEKAKN